MGRADTDPVGQLIGSNLWKVEIYDLIVAESLMRLADSGEYCLEVGQYRPHDSALAYAVGTVGHVVSFESQPRIFLSSSKMSTCGVLAWAGVK